ncbi:MAG: hypothetical protein ACR2N2_06075 [Acidimicrobiia bacterium]
MRVHETTFGDSPDDAKELSLSDRVEWVNAYERSIVSSGEGIVLEIDVYPIEDITDLPTADVGRGFFGSMRNAVTGRQRGRARRVPRRKV